jgi:hypothetical protein
VRARAKLRRGSRPSVAARAEDAAEEGDETDQVGPRCQRRGARVGLLCARRAEAKCGAGSRAGKRFAGLSGKEGGGLDAWERAVLRLAGLPCVGPVREERSWAQEGDRGLGRSGLVHRFGFGLS